MIPANQSEIDMLRACLAARPRYNWRRMVRNLLTVVFFVLFCWLAVYGLWSLGVKALSAVR